MIPTLCPILLVVVREIFALFMPGRQRIIYNRPPSKPHLWHARWECLLIPISSTVSFYIDLRPEAGCTFSPFRGLSVVAMKDAISKQIEENIQRYKIPVHINIHKKHVCVFLPSKGTGYCMMSVHTVETIDQEVCGKLKEMIQLSARI